MEKYEILQNGDNEMTISFYFNKKSLIVPSIIFISTFVFIFSLLKPEVLADTFIAIIILMLVSLFILFNNYFEWYRNKLHVLSIRNEDLYINNKFHCKLYKLQSINVVYLNEKYSLGWKVYLDVFPISSNDYIIKKQLLEKDAHEIAEKISIFLDRNVKIES
ncbi:hypothetical protein [Flavobacterium nitrogenifigens]|uniref:DUF304 domain-containing protein n=1 Tax=Flavobacterium nitrogenifigens TaxID=1617283 RepID=A0A521B2C7_9FLAO|nr:hypothetical protein [Flavobacterium nitrogenifigens]SMO41243.1 hypothetical protein SAMN06265220_101608 [Flavobacterium nitrogenifigens]